MTPPLPPACGHDRGCPDGEYWRAEAIAARDALHPLVVAVLPRLLPAELLAYDEPADPGEPLSGGQRLLAVALVGPWIACATGWAYVVAAHRAVGAVARWVRP